MAQILIIEDDAELRETLRLLLVAAEHTVWTAADGWQAIPLFSTKRFDLVITDLYMPEKDGLETIIDLRRMHPRTKIIAMSGRVAEKRNVLSAATALGAAQTLAKPFQPEELFRVVNEVLRS